MVAISIRNVSKLFGEFRAVDDITLDVHNGELFFILGPSGCGKTTILRMLAGFYFPDGGIVAFDGKDVSSVPPHERNTGMVFQNYALWPHMSVSENLAFGLEMRKVPKKERQPRIRKALEMVKMSDQAEKMPNQLSGGQQQRVAVARALALEPQVVLLDEPLSNLDAKLRLEMRAEITRIHEQTGMTFVYVTHDQSEALSMADRIAVMDKGKIIQVGAPREIYNRPATPFVAGFIGETNLISGSIKQTGAVVTIQTAAGLFQSSIFPDDIKSEDRVVCSIRPEALRVQNGGISLPNRFSCSTVRVMYLGNHRQYYVKTSDGTIIKALDFSSGSDARPGDTIDLGCAPEAVVVIKEHP